MEHDKSYDVAFQFTKQLEEIKSTFLEEESLIIYPSGWYEGFFEIIIREKDDVQKCTFVDIEKLKEIISKNKPSGWFLSKINMQRRNGLEGTPIKLQFKNVGVN